MPKQFDGVIGRTFEESRAWWPERDDTAADGSPNIVMVLLDDVGYAEFGCYGSDIATPTFDAIAANGLRYSNFHTTALCSPTRACLLTGRNHHANGMARIVEFASGFPGYNATIPADNGFVSQILAANGYATFALGKWHLAPAHEMGLGGPRTHWPLRKGFDRFYGFLAGETDQFQPDLIHDNHQIRPPRTAVEGYHLTEDLADQAIAYVKDLRAYDATKPFLMYVAPGACHAPHQAPASYIDPYRGRFDRGRDVWRDEVFARQVDSGLLPPGTELSERPSWVPEWSTLSNDQRRLYARMMEVYAGFLTHTDAQIGRILDFVHSLGETDNTIVIVMSDNGASAEGGVGGTFNEQYFFNFVPESFDENLRRIDDLGTPRANNHYPWGWAWAGNTPLKRFKRDTHEGGVCDPLLIRWPSRLGTPGETRHQYVHVTDLLPTLLDAIGIAAPDAIEGVAQAPFDGVSFAPTMTNPEASSAHDTQYYEMLGSRAIYHDGWKAVVFHPPAMMAYDGSDARRSFDDDVWELYHVADDFSECHDVAADHPDRLAELQALWWVEAERNQVLPLNNQPGRFGDRRFRRERYTYHPGISSIPESLAPNLRNRRFEIVAELDVPEHAPCDGIIVAHGGHSGGYALYIDGRRLHYVNNVLGAQITTISAGVDLPVGTVTVRATFTPSGRFQGDLELQHDGVAVGSGHLAFTTPLTYGVDPFCVGSQRMTPVAPALRGEAAIPDGVLRRVIIEPSGAPYRDPEGEARAARSRCNDCPLR